MTNKATKYGLMTIAAVLLVAMVFAGVGAADPSSRYTGNVELYVNNSGTWELGTQDIDDVIKDYGATYAYGISTIDELKDITGSEIYVLTQDIYCNKTLSESVIGTFTGTLIGNGYTIYNLTINANVEKIGLVSTMGDHSTLNYVNLTCANISSCLNYVGGLVGSVSSSEVLYNITGCNVIHSDISLIGTGQNCVGGLVGYSKPAGLIIRNCSVENCSITACDSRVGGLIGEANRGDIAYSNVKNCVIAGGGANVGGLVGFVSKPNEFEADNCKVNNCIIYGSGSYVGGLVGVSRAAFYTACIAVNCTIAGYDKVGGLFGDSAGSSLSECAAEDCAVAGVTGAVKENIGTGSPSVAPNAPKNVIVDNSSASTAVLQINITKIGATSSEYHAVNSKLTPAVTTPQTFFKENGYAYKSYDNRTSPNYNYITDLSTYGKENGFGYHFYTVTYNGNGNESGCVPVDTTQYTIANTKVTVLGNINNLVKLGYNFVGWNLGSVSGELIKPEATFTITEDTTLYANWSVVEYNITYNNMSGATNPAANPTTYNATSSLPITLDDAYKMGYKFMGWYNSSEFTEAYKNNTIPAGSTEDKVFYANWTVYSAEKSTSSGVAMFNDLGNVVKIVAIQNASTDVSKVNITYEPDTEAPSSDSSYTRTALTPVFNITLTGNLGSDNATIGFALLASQLNGASPDCIYLAHKKDGAWEYLKPTYVQTGDLYEFLVTGVTSFSPFVPISMTAVPQKYTPSSSKQTGSTIILSEGQVAPTAYATAAPTVAPTVKPTEKPATPTVIATEKPTTQPTQQSPAPFVGLLAGLGAAAVLLRLRK